MANKISILNGEWAYNFKDTTDQPWWGLQRAHPTKTGRIMSDWMSWLVVAGIMVVLELFTGTFYLLMIAVGLFAGALVAYLGWMTEFQVITAALVGAVATISLRLSRFGSANKISANRDPNVNLDIGQSIQINEWQGSSMGVFSARAMHRGALWDVEYAGKETPESGVFKIVEIRGSQLIVEHR